MSGCGLFVEGKTKIKNCRMELLTEEENELEFQVYKVSMNYNMCNIIILFTMQLQALEFQSHTESINACRLLNKDRVIATCSDDCTVAFWVSNLLGLYTCMCLLLYWIWFGMCEILSAWRPARVTATGISPLKVQLQYFRDCKCSCVNPCVQFVYLLV